MDETWINGIKLMVAGLELGIVAVFGLVLFETSIPEVWTFILVASVIVTFVGMLH